MTQPELSVWELVVMVAELRDRSKQSGHMGGLSPDALQRLLARAADAIEQLQKPDLFAVTGGDGEHFTDVARNFYRWHSDKIGEPVQFLAMRNCGPLWAVGRAVEYVGGEWQIAVDWFPTQAEAKMAALRLKGAP
jgi:hypothetical protein